MARDEWRWSLKYDPNQQRIPAGQPDGGRWTSTGGLSGAHATVEAFRGTETYRNIEANKFSDGREIFKGLMQEKGYIESKPEAVDSDSFDGVVAQSDHPVLYRGFHERQLDLEEQLAGAPQPRDNFNQFVDGPQFLGRGVNGSGSYTTTDPFEAQEYAGRRGFTNIAGGSVVRMAIKPGAKVVDLWELEKGEMFLKDDPPLFKKMFKATFDAYNSGDTSRGDKLHTLYRAMHGKYNSAYLALRNDSSAWAIMKGADVIRATNRHYIVLNRAALWVDDSPFDADLYGGEL